MSTDFADAAVPPTFSRGFRRYALSILMLIYVFNFLDRQIVTILAEPIKNDLHLADWQLGLMTGLSFALFYTLLGFPIARLAERGDRPLLISLSVAAWSLATTVCGLTQTFWQLIAARIGVGVGEAGCTPAVTSLIADYTPKEERASAMSMYALGSPIGTLLGLAIGGVVASIWGWRAAFLVVGAPGLVLAVIAYLTLREPRRRLKGMMATQAEASPPFWEAFDEIRRNKTIWRLIGGGATRSFVQFGMGAFMASFLMRNHAGEIAALGAHVGLKGAGVVGPALGLTAGVGGAVGAVLGGRLVDHFARRDVRAYATIPALGMICGMPFLVGAILSPSFVIALLLLMAAGAFSTWWTGPIYGAVQGLFQPRVRATATATMLFTNNLIGLGLGPLAVGLVSDFYSKGLALGPAAGVKWAILTFLLLDVPASLFYLSGARTLRAELIH